MSPKSTTSAKAGWAWGGMLLASVLLIMTGLWQMLEGIAAVSNDKILNPQPNYVFRFTPTTWGWIHFVIGLLAVVVGCGLFTSRLLWRQIAMVIVGLSAVSNFLFLPYYPFWAIVLIAVDLLIIWALASYEEPGDVEGTSPFEGEADVVKGPGITAATQTQVPR